MDAGFANGWETGNPLGPTWEDGQAWKNPQQATERSHGTGISLMGQRPILP